MQVKAIEERFWVKVNKTETCWLWAGATNGVGYGVIGRGGRGSGNAYAHRLSYEWAKGPIPEGLDLDHLCRNRACVNPDHLEPVTRSVNLSRSPLVGKALSSRTHCVNGHELSGANAAPRAEGGRRCRECRRLARRVYFAAHREEELAKNREYHRQGRRNRRAT